MPSLVSCDETRLLPKHHEVFMPGFSSPPDPQAYKFMVWEIVSKVPTGKVATYGQIAALVGAPAGMAPQNYRPLGPRWVGGAMAACPPNVPWHRVINSKGKVSLPGASGLRQNELLMSEGIEINESGRIDLKKYQWDGVFIKEE
jgi:methylated-DNA-protein-cysteine methyltransferase-like protein